MLLNEVIFAFSKEIIFTDNKLVKSANILSILISPNNTNFTLFSDIFENLCFFEYSILLPPI